MLTSCRSPHGERGLKFESGVTVWTDPGRSPHGERGLKFRLTVDGGHKRLVALLMESVD